MPNQPAVVALDLGGVLLEDQVQPVMESITQFVPGAGDLWAHWNQSVRVPAELGKITGAEAIRRLATTNGVSPALIERNLLRSFERIPSGRLTVQQLRSAGVRMVLATNHVNGWLEQLLDIHPWLPSDEIVNSAAVGARKPDHAYFVALRDQTGPGIVPFVDDKRDNLDAAADAGFDPILADNNTGWTAALLGRFGLDDVTDFSRDEYGRASYWSSQIPDPRDIDSKFGQWRGRTCGPWIMIHVAEKDHHVWCTDGWVPSGEWSFVCSRCWPDAVDMPGTTNTQLSTIQKV